MLRAGNNLGFQLAFNLGFAFAFVSAFYVIGYVKERVSKAKLLQVVSGVNMAVYWTTAFIWDYATFVVTTFLTLLTLFAFQEEQWTHIDELGRAFLVIMISGVCFLPMVYLGSLLFSIPATGFTRMSILFIFTGTGMFTIIFTMRFEEFELVDRARVMTYIFLIFPHFALSDAISNINIVNSVRAVCEQSCENNIFCNNIEDLCAIPDLERCCSKLWNWSTLLSDF
jgi:ATP-binding cassette, subfamily A (ABC1), member 3